MERIFCFLKGIWRSITSPQLWQGGFPISGHIFTKSEDHTNCEIEIVTCEDCGKWEIWWEHSGYCKCKDTK